MSKDFHPDFIELCALRTAGDLSAEEEVRLSEHLRTCLACRQISAEYEGIVARVVPTIAEGVAGKPEGVEPDWSSEDAESRLFARIHEESPKGEPSPRVESAPHREQIDVSIDALWRRLWWQLAATVLLLIGLSVSLYKVAERHGASRAERSMAAVNQAQPALPRTEDGGLARRAESSVQDQQIAHLEQRIAAQAGEIERLRRNLPSDEERAKATTALAQVTAERNALAQQLAESRANLQLIQMQAEAGKSDTDSLRGEQRDLSRRVQELESQLKDRDLQLAENRDLLDRDRDIRDLMSSRELYIAEVYDVAKSGETQKPFGRVFYTRGKSLIFYAYDLNDQAGVTEASTFQAWGRRGPDRDKALNLGIFYEDNATSRRWVLKTHSAKALSEIDAVFVTVEPKGGSSHPSTKPLLFAYLKVDPNHP